LPYYVGYYFKPTIGTTIGCDQHRGIACGHYLSYA